MALRNSRRNRNSGVSSSQQDERDQVLGNYTVEQTFDPPKIGIVAGQFVKISSQGNHEGHSPAYLCWDDAGQSSIESLEDVTLVDMSAIPPTVDQMRRLLKGLDRS